MEIRYSNNVVLKVDITYPMVEDWRKCRSEVCRVGGFPNCEECSLNISFDRDGDLLLCDLAKVRHELNRMAGEPEECREAVEKQIPKEPVIGADFMVGTDDDGNPIWAHDYVCPECGMGIAMEYICCPYCGMYIDWSKGGIE